MVALAGEVTSTNHETDTGPAFRAHATAGSPFMSLSTVRKAGHTSARSPRSPRTTPPEATTGPPPPQNSAASSSFPRPIHPSAPASSPPGRRHRHERRGPTHAPARDHPAGATIPQQASRSQAAARCASENSFSLRGVHCFTKSAAASNVTSPSASDSEANSSVPSNSIP